MGASGKWIKSLIGLKPSSKNSDNGGAKPRKWTRLWRTSSASRTSSSRVSTSSASETSSPAAAAAVATIVRAPPRDFKIVRQEWAAVRIQAAFRAFLARRALRALRGIVRLQALARGRRVRRQLAVTLGQLHALVRAQSRARELRARLSADGRGAHDVLEERRSADPVKEAEEQWCDSQGTLDQVRSKIHTRHEGATKRERAIAYARSHQQRSSRHNGRPSSPSVSLKHHETDRSNCSWSYFEGWIATKPWENRLMEQSHTESPNLPYFKSCEDPNLANSKPSDAGSVKITRNNVTTRVVAKPPSMLSHNRCGSQSASSSDFLCDESSPSTSSITLLSGTTFLASERRIEGSHGGGPNYMNLTKSAKAKRNGYNAHRATFQRQGSGDLKYYNRVAFSLVDSQSNAGSDLSVTSRRLNSMSLKGRSLTRSLDKENNDTSTMLF